MRRMLKKMFTKMFATAVFYVSVFHMNFILSLIFFLDAV